MTSGKHGATVNAARARRAQVAAQRLTTPLFKPQALDAALIEGFQRIYLWERFDKSAPTAAFHRTMWAEFSDPFLPRCAWAAPRSHAKSTAITLTAVMAAMVFRFRDYCLIISDSESQAIRFLKDIKIEFTENEELRRDFKVTAIPKDNDTELEVEFADGHIFRIEVRGAEQRFRGFKWRNKRPNLIIGDDMEFDEIVANPERRLKFKDTMIKQVFPAGSKDCLFRIVGTILHFDSFLMGLLNDKDNWTSHLWSAHHSFNDFSEILWPEQYNIHHWKSLRAQRIAQGKADAYSQEYLNRPQAEEMAFFRRGEMLAIPTEETIALNNGRSAYDTSSVNYYVSVDWAVSERQHADKTCITVAAVGPDGYLDIVDVRKGRFDPRKTIDIIFDVDEQYEPLAYLMEQGTIEKAIGPFLNEEMVKRNRYLTMELMSPSRDKQFRAQSIRARMRAGRVRFDKEAPWWPEAEEEMVQFPRGAHDDFVDTMSQFGLAMESIIAPPSQDELDEEEYQRDFKETMDQGRSRVTGY